MKKGLDFSVLKQRLLNPRNDLPNFPYEFWVNKTAKLLNRPYIGIHKIITQEGLKLEGIIRRYETAVKHSGDMPPDVYWWWRRKVEFKNENKKNVSDK